MDHSKNIIQPPKLGQNKEEIDLSTSKTLNTPNIAEQVTALVTDVLRREGRQILTSLLNPPTDISNDVDQPITIGLDKNLSDMDKIPDIVKSLREFSGSPGEFSSWKKSVERILTIYEPLKGTAKYYGILSVIRNKIVGHADIALESYNTPLNWGRISRCLTLHYADKRDLGTLEYQMTTLVQGRSTIPEFYQEVYHHLSLILNKLCSLNMSQEALNIMTQSYREKALDTFVRGLKGELPRLLSIKEPVDLPQALHLCLKLENVDFRTQYANNLGNGRRNLPPPVPPRRTLPLPRQIAPVPAPRNNFYPELINYPQKPQRPYFQRQFPQQSYPQQSYPQQSYPQPPFNTRQLPPKPLPRPEPMDIDHSIHSRVANYQNRPRTNQFTQKGPSAKQMLPSYKQQRIFNTELQNLENQNEIEGYEQQITQEDSNYDQTLIDYTETMENPTLEDTEQIDDIYFLD